MDLDRLLQNQREYFRSGATLPVYFRVAMLKKLRDAVERHEEEIAAALKADLGKSDFEGFMCETGLVKSELSYMIRHTRRFASQRRVHTPLAQFASASYQKPSPYGNVLIMSPWNYPFLLTIDPLADAIAAGNTAVVKPSAYSPATSAVIAKMIGECFPPEYVAAVTGGRKENATLLEKKFDLIFFTGSQAVGREVLRHAAGHLTPAVLELGGKSPCIVDGTAKLELAAKRIVFGKYLNCGQTCVAPDYILCHRSVKEKLVQELCRQVRLQYGEDPLANPDYGKIINEKHFDRLCGLLAPEKHPGDQNEGELWMRRGNNSYYGLVHCGCGKQWFARFKMARRDGLHWAFARCYEAPTPESLAKWEKQKRLMVERLKHRTEKAEG